MTINKCLLIIGTCLGLASCTPIEREVAEEGLEAIIEIEQGATAPPYHQEPNDFTFAHQKHDDTNPATQYKGRKTSKSLYRPDTRGHQAEANYRQYPRRKGTPGRCDSTTKDA